MATPIVPTPVLEGEEAERFYREMEENESKLLPELEVVNMLKDVRLFKERNPQMAYLFGGLGV